VFQIRMQSRIK